MKAIFGVVSLLVALAIVGIVATRQLKAVGKAGAAATPPATTSASAPAPTVREQARLTQAQVANDIAKAAQQGAARQADADK